MSTNSDQTRTKIESLILEGVLESEITPTEEGSEKPYIVAFPMSYVDKIIAVVEAGFSDQAKQHQVELLRARIDERNHTVPAGPYWSGARLDIRLSNKDRIAQLQAELAKLTGENSNE